MTKRKVKKKPIYEEGDIILAKMKDGREWKLELTHKFHEIFKDMSPEQRKKIFNFMHRKKGMSMETFLKERKTFGLSEAEQKVALQARELWNVLFKASGMKPEKYWQEYQPIIFRMLADPDGVIHEFYKLPKDDVVLFFENRRIAEGNFILAGAEQVIDPIELFEIYSSAVMKKIYFSPPATVIKKILPLLPKSIRNHFEHLFESLTGHRTKNVEALDMHLQRAVQLAVNNTLGKKLHLEDAVQYIGFP